MPLAALAILMAQTRPTDRPVEPVYASAEAKRLATRSQYAYQRLKFVSYDYVGSAGTARVWWSPQAMRQTSGASDWSYRNGILTIHVRGGWYSGKSSKSTVSFKLAKARITVEPMLLKLLTGRNPAAELFSVDKTIRAVGKGKIDGQATRMLEASNKLLRVAVTLREADGLISGTVQSSLDVRGRVVTTSQQRYTYRSVNTAFGPGGAILTPPGPTKPLSALAP